MLRTGYFVIGVFIACLALTGCGKKAADVDPPPGVENDTFPHFYPDPATDPAATMGTR